MYSGPESEVRITTKYSSVNRNVHPAGELAAMFLVKDKKSFYDSFDWVDPVI